MHSPGRFYLRVLAFMVFLASYLSFVIWDAFHSRQPAPAEWKTSSLEWRIETSPALSGVVYDRNGEILAEPVAVTTDGRRRFHVKRPQGTPLAAAGLGKWLVLTEGVQGNLSGSLRAGGFSIRQYPRSSYLFEFLLGDPQLAPYGLPPIQTTLDLNLSRSIYRVLEKTRRVSSVIVMDRTGQIWAAVDYPGPDVDSDQRPNGDKMLFSFLATTTPGSTWKILTAAFMLAGRQGNIWVVRECVGIRCWMKHGPVYGLPDAVRRSCNGWFRLASKDLDYENWKEFLLSVNAAPLSSPGIPDGELVLPQRRARGAYWPQIVGQEVTVSPLGLTAAFATVTDLEGRQVHPSVILKVNDQELPQRERLQVLAPQVTSEIRSLLHLAAQSGTASIVNSVYSRRNAGGKTGTPQRGKGQPNDAVFVAVVPWSDPQWIATVVLRAGGSGRNAGKVAGQILNLLPQ